ncbi:MAG TPA: acylphosphatase [Gemmatimonadales bacterium]|nr:acylphosphatase [Gemmatimonadales bacterium]
MSARFVVTGRVQGVGFRWFVVKQARALGLGGYVRNLEDGSVEVVAVGDPDAIDRLAAALAHGPAAADVRGVERSEAGVQAASDGFDVR